ncbi:hypothetical protein V6N11_012283 [Hibiscus sabdariffa]|uniref:RNase H type-1 domain-containing protein n=1 Tax=Hibiscus sabdariffa TaxID=183260 RepID=A0ABR2QAP9_9ROSI
MVRDGKFLKEKHWTNCFPILVSIITYSKIIVFDLLEDQFVNHTCLFSDGRHLYQLIYETEILQRLSSKKQHVVSTGGGAVVLDENWDYMQKKGIVVWLDVPLEALARRIAAVGTHSRPLLHYEHGDPYTKAKWLDLFTFNDDVIRCPYSVKFIKVGKRDSIVCKWVKPPVKSVKFNVDGAVERGFGRAGIGGILRDSNGKTLILFSKSVGSLDATTAELLALKEAVNIFRKSTWLNTFNIGN